MLAAAEGGIVQCQKKNHFEEEDSHLRWVAVELSGVDVFVV